MAPLTSRLPTVAGVGLSVLLAASASAQTGFPLSLQVSGIYQSMSGANAEQIPSGPGAELQLRHAASAWSLGLGFDYTKHSPDYDGSVVFYCGFLEPRYTFDVKSDRFAPYLSARIGFAGGKSRYSYTDETDVYASAADISGTTLSGGGGLLVMLTPGVNLDVGVTIGSTQFLGRPRGRLCERHQYEFLSC